jgi:hypothetical protein
MPFADMAARLAASRLGVDATHYQAGSAVGVPVRVVLSAPDQVELLGAASAAVSSVIITVPSAALPDPQERDTFVVGGDVYAVMAVLRDARGVSWRLPCRRQTEASVGSLRLGAGL